VNLVRTLSRGVLARSRVRFSTLGFYSEKGGLLSLEERAINLRNKGTSQDKLERGSLRSLEMILSRKR